MSLPFVEGAATGFGFPILGKLIAPYDKATEYVANYNTPVLVLHEYLLTTLMTRGELEESVYFELMRMHGYDAMNATRYVQALKPLPSKTDLVQYVVKEAYTPEVLGELLGKEGNEPPPEFVKQMARLGFGSADSLYEWRKHYDPLGRAEFEELFHRLNAEQLAHKKEDMAHLGIEAKDVVTDMDFLLRMYKIKDIYPGLRKRMALISYKTPTRIDIRRFEDYGLIDKSDLVFFNRELGYSPTIAEKMAQYTVLSNALADIKPLVMTGALSIADGAALLMDEGATAEQAAKLMNRLAPYAKASRTAKDRDLAIGDYLEAFEFNMYTRPQTKAELMRLGLDDTEAELKIRIREHKMKIKAAGTTAKPKNLTKTDIIAAYRNDSSYTRTIAKADLIKAGYDANEAERLLDTEDSKPRKGR